MPREQTIAARLREQESRNMTAQQVAFLRDVQGYIDFAIRNSLSFTTVMNGLVHDANQIARFGYDDEAARAGGFKPKTAGFADLSSDDFGESEEEPDA